MNRLKRVKIRTQRGFSLLEVLIGIVIFSIGMLALASFQGNLTRSVSDSNLRMVAINISEEFIESKRGFARIFTDPDNVFVAYQDIGSTSQTVTRGGVDYTLAATVTDYYYDLATDSFVTTAPAGVLVSDYKHLLVTVSWGSQDFRTDAGQEISGANLGTGSITMSEGISSTTTTASSRTVTQEVSDLVLPPINYTPGQNPDVVSLSLGNNKFKESLTPEPDVIRRGELVETRFDVVTYSQSGNNSAFLRREELIGVSCECELKAPPADADDAGRRPAIWLGDEYLEPEFIVKPYGVSANNFQSSMCDTCCQDHHDGGTGTQDPAGDPGATQYDPFRASTDYWNSGVFNGDHKHYKKNQRGELSVADTDGDVYVEACKMVRKDGFFRVAQDFRQEGLNVFQHDFLDETAEVDGYSAYVTTSVNNYVNATYDAYEAAPPVLVPPSRTAEGVSPAPATDLTAGYTFLPTNVGSDFQQLRSRGIYMDYLAEDLRSVISCLNGGGSAETCQSGLVELDQTGSANVLELIPFFEVQLTYLNRWRENPPNDPVDTTNEALETGNTHSRGVASKEASVGSSTVFAKGDRGVPGLTDTDPIDMNFTTNLVEAEIQVVINNSNPPPPNGRLITGVISSGVNGLQATSVEILADDALCNRTPDGFTCLVANGNSTATLTLSNYKKQSRSIVACSALLPSSNGTDEASNPFAVFELGGVVDGGQYLISMEQDSCF